MLMSIVGICSMEEALKGAEHKSLRQKGCTSEQIAFGRCTRDWAQAVEKPRPPGCGKAHDDADIALLEYARGRKGPDGHRRRSLR